MHLSRITRITCLASLIVSFAVAVEPLPKAVEPAPISDTVHLPLPPAPPTLDPAIADLKSRLPDVPGVVERDGKLWWQGKDASQAVAFTAIDERRQPQVATVFGTITVQRRLIEEGRSDALAALLILAPLAKEAGITGELRLAEGPLTGLHLRGADNVVLPGGVLTLQKASDTDRGAEVRELTAAVETLKGELPSLALEESARRALGEILDKLSSTEHTSELDDASPDFCRRVVRSGWLRQFFPTVQSDDRIEAAVIKAETPLPTKRWAGTAGELCEVHDAFGRSRWILRSSTRSAWLTENPDPIYFSGMPAMVTVVEVEPGSDPLAASAVQNLRGARSWRQSDTDWTPVGTWTAASGKLELTAQAWTAAVPRRNRSPSVGD